MKTVLQRPEPIEFEASGGTKFVVAPATRGQVRAALALEPAGEEDENAIAFGERRAQQVAALVGPQVQLASVEAGVPILRSADSGPILAQLTPDQENEVLWALIGQATGHDPRAAVAMHRGLKKKELMPGLSGSRLTTGALST